MDKTEILKQVEAELDKTGGSFRQPLIRYDKKWRYFHRGDTQKTCPLLDTMFKIEYNSGTIVFIPDDPNKFGQPGNVNRNEEEG